TVGTAWTYTVTEGNIPDYTKEVGTASGKGNADYDVEEPETTKLTDDLLNSIYNANVNFRKERKDQNNNTIDTEYLDLNVTVTFKLQVSDDDGKTWQWASDYFDDDNLASGAAKAIEDAVTVDGKKVGEDYTATLSGTINDT